jgi:TMEM175 potassium channel family protein
MYNRIAGKSLERIAALSDGLFAIAMTLIVLDIRVPPATAVHGEADLGRALLALSPRIVMYLMSFLTLGIFWVGQQTQLNFLARADRDLAWIHIAFLAAVATMPFSTTLLAEFITYRTAMLVYWVNLLLLGATLYWSWRHARHADLIKRDAPTGIDQAIERRIIIAQSLYAVGVMFCVVSTFLSIAFIFLVQLYYAVAPGLVRHSGPPAARSSSEAE